MTSGEAVPERRGGFKFVAPRIAPIEAAEQLEGCGCGCSCDGGMGGGGGGGTGSTIEVPETERPEIRNQ